MLAFQLILPSIVMYNLGRIGEIYTFSPEYGITIWEINCLFLVTLLPLIVPFVYYQSYKGVGEMMTSILRMITNNGLHTGNALYINSVCSTSTLAQKSLS